MTFKELQELKPHTIFKTGVVKDNPEGINMTNSYKELRWIAKKGYADDWCIYIHWSFNSQDFIARSGDKVCNKNHIKKLVSCDDEMFEAYRY